MPPRPSEVPAIIARQYNLGEKLGNGGQATAWKGEKNGDPITFKVYTPFEPRKLDKELEELQQKEQWQRQVPQNKNIAHPIGNAFTFGGKIYSAATYQPGTPLSNYLSKPPPLEVNIYEEGYNFAGQLSALIKYLSGKDQEFPLLHNDLKPGNLTLDEHGNLYIIDRGLTTPSPHTWANRNGTPPYMSPEAALKTERDGRSDLFSVGLVIRQQIFRGIPFGVYGRNSHFAQRHAKGETSTDNKAMRDVMAKRLEPNEHPTLAPEILERLKLWDLMVLRHQRDDRATPDEAVDILNGAYENPPVYTGPSTINISPRIIRYPEAGECIMINGIKLINETNNLQDTNRYYLKSVEDPEKKYILIPTESNQTAPPNANNPKAPRPIGPIIPIASKGKVIINYILWEQPTTEKPLLIHEKDMANNGEQRIRILFRTIKKLTQTLFELFDHYDVTVTWLRPTNIDQDGNIFADQHCKIKKLTKEGEQYWDLKQALKEIGGLIQRMHTGSLEPDSEILKAVEKFKSWQKNLEENTPPHTMTRDQFRTHIAKLLRITVPE